MQQASCLEGDPLLWIWPLYLHVNKKSDDDDDDDDDFSSPILNGGKNEIADLLLPPGNVSIHLYVSLIMGCVVINFFII